MKKLLLPLIVVVALVAVFVLGPMLTGGQVEKIVLNQLEQVKTKYAIEPETFEYNKSLTGATYVTEIDLIKSFVPADQQIPEDTQLIIKESGTVKHGPVIFDNGLKIGRASIQGQVEIPMLADALEEVGAVYEKPFVKYSSFIPFSNEQSSQFTLESLELSAGDNQLTYSGAAIDYANDAENIFAYSKGAGDLGNLALNKLNEAGEVAQSVAKVDGMAIDFDYAQFEGSQSVYVGDASLTVASVEITTPMGPAKINGTTLTASSSAQGESLNSHIELDVNELTFPMAPAASSLNIKFGLDGISVATYEALTALQTPAAVEVSQEQVIATVDKLLQDEVTFNVNKAVNAAGMGNIVSDLTVEYQPDENGKPLTFADLSTTNSFEPLLNYFIINLSVAIDESLITALPMALPMISPYVEQGILVKQNGKYELVASYESGSITINGQTKPYMEWISILSGQPQEQAIPANAPAEAPVATGEAEATETEAK